jgi:ABC-2 type transport system ATP-binding protein
VSNAAIEVHGLHKRYGEFEAVRGIDISVASGEVFGLLGPNGAGKTTTVEILEGYRERTSGEVSVLGHDPAAREIALRKRIGIVLQSSGIYSHVTPREALRHWASFYPHSRDVEEVLSLMGLQEKADVRTRKLSGGQLRRLDFALALVGDPELIFLDEPTTGFDPQARRAAWETIRSLRELGKTILLTTHYLDEAQALADRVAIVKDGRVLAIGPPRELGTDPPGAHPSGAAHYRVSYRKTSGEIVEHQTDDPTSLLARLTSETLARGERLEELSVGRPTLEDVYLELTTPSIGDSPGIEADNATEIEAGNATGIEAGAARRVEGSDAPRVEGNPPDSDRRDGGQASSRDPQARAASNV